MHGWLSRGPLPDRHGGEPRKQAPPRTRGCGHAALVFDEAGCAQGWCQYGNPEELARVKHRRAYEQEPPPWPDWRIQCFFVDPRHRGQGIARAALEGALAQIAEHGGGRAEAISEVTTGREAHGRFLVSATVELYGFSRGRQLGKHAYLVSRLIDPVSLGSTDDG